MRVAAGSASRSAPGRSDAGRAGGVRSPVKALGALAGLVLLNGHGRQLRSPAVGPKVGPQGFQSLERWKSSAVVTSRAVAHLGSV